MLFAGLVWRLGAARAPSADLQALATRELRDLANGSGRVDIRSGDRGDIQRWMKARLNIDIRLADRQALLSDVAGDEMVRIIGARIIRFERFSVGVITYRVGRDYAALLVADRRAGFSGTAVSGHEALGVDYAIAFGSTKEPERPCLLCHTGAPAVMVLR
jgi:hypothetical protein